MIGIVTWEPWDTYDAPPRHNWLFFDNPGWNGLVGTKQNLSPESHPRGVTAGNGISFFKSGFVMPSFDAPLLPAGRTKQLGLRVIRPTRTRFVHFAADQPLL